MIVALNIRFSLEAIEMIQSVSVLLNLQISNENINLVKETFDINSKPLETEINLLRHTENLPNDENIYIDKYILND